MHAKFIQIVMRGNYGLTSHECKVTMQTTNKQKPKRSYDLMYIDNAARIAKQVSVSAGFTQCNSPLFVLAITNLQLLP